uniref:Uncharacterized protein n=1 Tax=Musca domestica TaxID=7370 RepID=A0A1I8MUJ3_MUSDO
MSHIETKEDVALTKRLETYCCAQKQYYINSKCTLVNTLKILPRVVIYKNSLKIGSCYESLITIKNEGLHNRRLLYTTDSEDISISTNPENLMDNFLESEQTVQLSICLKPTKKLNINRRRHIFIEAEHPNLKFELPIIILGAHKIEVPSIPELLVFPSTSVGSFTFYELVLYNGNSEKTSFNVKGTNSHLTLFVPNLTIPKRDYCTILLKLACKAFTEVSDVIKYKFGSVETNLSIKAQDGMRAEYKSIKVKGFINGPDIEIIPKCIDFRNVYFGEEQCASIKVLNVDGLSECHVDYYDFISHDEASVVITPAGGYDLKPCQSAIFNLQFFAKVVGKFLITLQFKVRNGNFFTTLIRGVSQQVRVKCFPDIIDLDIVPVCVPQKRLVLLMNPLSVPITVQCCVPNDGIETPLVLNINDTNQHLPINVKDPIIHMLECQENEEIISRLDDDDSRVEVNCGNMIVEMKNSEMSLQTYRSMINYDSSSITSYSTEFQEEALDSIPTIASNLIYHLKKLKIFDKPDMEQKVIEEALSALLQTSYFYDMDKYKNYCNMDWNSLSSDPKEIYCNNEIIYLNPNTGKVISVVVIPNVIGHQQKYIELRVCPILPPSSNPDDDNNVADSIESNLQQIVRSNNLLSKLWVEYNCSVPEIVWDNVINMQDPLYAGELYEFEMIFENCSKIGGFFYFDVIPDNEYGTMKFLNYRWKYFVEPESIIKVPCAVEYKKPGFISLLGLIKFIGVNTGFPFHIKSEVLLPQININPQQIVKRVTVLERTNFYIYIDNITPTTTWFSMKLKDEIHFRIYPEGGQLAPTGQGMVVLMEMYFTDPGLYRNTWNIIMQYETVKKIPITIHVEGMPIFFEPDIQLQDFNIGTILCTTENEYYSEISNYTKLIRVVNRGKHSYRIAITKTKSSSKPICHITQIKAKLLIKPNNLVMDPMSQDQFFIVANACEPVSIHNEFRIDIIDLAEPTRKQSSRFVIRGQFSQPELMWNCREIKMDYCRTHKYKEHPQWELLKLTNTTNNFIEMVCLKVFSPFMLKEHFECPSLKELEFAMCPAETKEIFLILDKKSVKEHNNSTVDGRINCSANSHKQKSVNIKLNIFTPSLNIQHNNVTLFVKNAEGGTFIPVRNSGNVPAMYKWSKLQENWHYISEEDDSQQVADIIISDIIASLNLETIIFENDPEPNMTKRYQKLRCVLPKLEDPIGVRKILDDIINELDLTHKRYKLELLEPLPPAEPRLSSSKMEILEKQLCLHELSPDILENIINEPEKSGIAHHDQEHIAEPISNKKNDTNSKTLYYNKNFCKVPSSSNLLEQTSSTAYVYHTLDEILQHIKIEDSYTISEPSSETCDVKGRVYFFEKSGIVQGRETIMCALHIPPIRRGFEVCATFQLQIIGGESQEFRINLVNLDRTLKLSKDSVYLGVKPWYEQFMAQVLAENITNYEINLNTQIISKTSRNLPSSIIGYIKMLDDKELTLPPFDKIFLKFEGSMGLSEEGFKRELCITINNGEVKTVKFLGQGIMPIFIAEKRNLSQELQTTEEIINEYRFLQKIYYFEMFTEITEYDNELFNMQAEERDVNKSICSLMELSQESSGSILDESHSTTARSTTRRNQELNFFRCVLKSYVLINNNEELPNATVLEHLLETERFLQQLQVNAETRKLFKILHQEYQRSCRNSNVNKFASNFKYFTIQPLLFQMRGVVLELGNLVFNQYHNYSVSLEFLGPGKLIAAARSVIEIPGVFVDIEAEDKAGDLQFICHRPNQNQCKTKQLKRYRNMYERIMDVEVDPKIRHAHSFDIDKRSQHQRSLRRSRCTRKWLVNHYGSLNKSIYAELKHHHTHCKIFTKCKNETISGAKLNVVILIRPERLHYAANQQIEDYLFIDLHMGPTLPILLRGTIKDSQKL